MLPEEILQDVYDRFRLSAEWPYVRDLQIAHRRIGNFRHVAAQTGRDRIVCEEGPEGRCFLRLTEVVQRRHSEEDISHFLATLRQLASWYAANGSAPLSSSDIAGALDLGHPALTRLGALLYRESGPWAAASWGNDGSSFSLQPSEEALFYDSVGTVNAYLAARQRFAEEAVATSRLLMRPRPIRQEPLRELPVSPPRVVLADPILQAILDRDLGELDRVLQVQAWKAASVLAGSCLEAVLLDLWKRDEAAAKATFKANWPTKVSGHELARAAVAAGLVHEDYEIASSLLRRWRNVIHPAAELRSSEPHEQLAQALVAILHWLLAHLRGEPRRAAAIPTTTMKSL